MTPTFVLREYGSTDDPVRLSHQAVARLQAAAGSALAISPGRTADDWVLNAGGIVGTVVTSDVRVLIRPKVDAANLFYMLEVGGDALDVSEAVFEYDTHGDLLASFATFFARTLERALARGVPRSYAERSDRLFAVRGRVDVTRQIRGGGLPLPIDCDFDEHTADSQLNRIVLAAIDRLGCLPAVAARTRSALHAARSHFDDVGPLLSGDVGQSTRFTRLDDHFRATEHLARIVLRGTSIVDRRGTSAAGSFLVNMATLFERFVEDRLRKHLRGSLDVSGQHRTALDHDGRVRMKPDLVFRRRGADVYVGDCKYKLTASGLGRESDYYQLLAYCTALGLPEGVLVYCQHDGTVPAREVSVRGADMHLATWPVQLSGPPAEIEARLAALGRHVAGRSAERSVSAAAAV